MESGKNHFGCCFARERDRWRQGEQLGGDCHSPGRRTGVVALGVVRSGQSQEMLQRQN